MSTDTLTDSLIEWLRGERVPLSRFRLVEEITLFARHSRSWPTATPRQWGEAVDSACRQGLLVERDGLILIAPATEPELTEKEVQLDLF
ncbi:MAG: hypothetical protein IT422_04920 [Pirellulaceae bacterium]|nr:hypothetical protein [Pirellulaceae bacterium]